MPAEINRRIIKPAIKELTEKNYFKSIFFEEIKKNIGNAGYKISFDDSNRKQ